MVLSTILKHVGMEHTFLSAARCSCEKYFHVKQSTWICHPQVSRQITHCPTAVSSTQNDEYIQLAFFLIPQSIFLIQI